MKNNELLAVSLLAVCLAAIIAVHMFMHGLRFTSAVHESERTSEGYDQKLISMVDALEHELAIRAAFGYTGGKDPMTGKTRQVITPEVVRFAPAAAKRAPTAAAPAPAPAPAPQVAQDPIRLTAIIFDEKEKRYTAIIMDGERSLSVQVGDQVQDRKITEITREALSMESGDAYYRYDSAGRRARKAKWGMPAVDSLH